MSSQPLEQQQPPMAVTQQAYSPHSGGGSVGPVIAVLAVITVLGIIAGMIGRLCAGGRIFGHRQYDFEGWIERKCGSCIDGRIEPALPRPPPPTLSSAPDGAGSSSVPIAIPMEAAPQGGGKQRAAEHSTRRTA